MYYLCYFQRIYLYIRKGEETSMPDINSSLALGGGIKGGPSYFPLSFLCARGTQRRDGWHEAPECERAEKWCSGSRLGPGLPGPA